MQHEPANARQFVADDEQRVLEILRLAFGEWPAEINCSPAEFFHWKHRTSTFGESVLFVVELNGEVAGFAAYMPWRFRAGERTLSALRGVDYAVHPDYRRRGATHAIRTASNALTGAESLWSNPNEPARRGGAKFGRRQLGKVPRFARPCRRVHVTTWRALGRGAPAHEPLAIEAPTAGEVLRDDELVERALADVVYPPGRLVTDKSPGYLRWRYGQFDEYRAVRCDSARKGRGIAIFRARRYGSFWVMDVCELLVARNRDRVALDLLAQVAGSAAADFVSCSFPSRRRAAAHGFVQASRGSNLISEPLRDGVGPDPTRRGSWALSRGDLELL